MKYIIFVIGMILLSCTTAKKCAKYYPPMVEREFTTEITYRDTTLIGGNVQSVINVDSIIQLPGKTITVKDTTGNAELLIWVDEYGKLRAKCSSKDQLIEKYKQTIKHLRNETKTPPEVIIKETPVWNWLLIGALIVVIIYLVIRKILI
jgi:hypothetical protein